METFAHARSIRKPARPPRADVAALPFSERPSVDLLLLLLPFSLLLEVLVVLEVLASPPEPPAPP